MTKTSKVFKWFGFRLHLIADATYEMPVAFTVTKASNSEKAETEKLLERLKKEHPEYLDTCKYFLEDKGYDSRPLIMQLMQEDIIPIIFIPFGLDRNFTGKETREKNSSISFRRTCSLFMIQQSDRVMRSGTGNNALNYF